MTFDSICDDFLFATRYDGDNDNILVLSLEKWFDVSWLKSFFEINNEKLDFFGVNVQEAVQDTIEDINEIVEILYNSPPNLESFFMPLGEKNLYEFVLQQNKGKLKHRPKHPSWIRFYAIRLEKNVYLITGGAIKLTKTMQEDPETEKELEKIKRCRRYLFDNNIIDRDSFIDNFEL